MPRVQFQFVILCQGSSSESQSYVQKEREYNCLRGQVNGHKATLYFTLSTTYLGTFSSLTNFAEFLAFRALSSPVLCRVPLLRVILVQAPKAWGQSFLHIGLAV
jgi:hypothetical protein